MDLLPLALLALALTGAIWRLLRTLDVPHAEGLAVVLALAQIALAQADSLWAAPCLLVLDAAMLRRHAAMLAWFGLALLLRSEAAQLAPFVAAVLIARRVRPALWLLAALAASPLAVALMHMEAPPALTHGAANPWFVVAALRPADAPRLVGLALAAGVGASACYIAHVSARLPAGLRLLPVALLATLVTAGLLPGMPAGSIMLAVLIASIWALAARASRAWQVAVLVAASATLARGGDALGESALIALAAVAIGAATWLVAAPALRPAANDNPVPMRALRRAPI